MAEDLREYFDKKFGNFREEIVHQFHVISEDVVSKVQQVAEGVANLNEKFDRRIIYLETELQTLKHRVEQIEIRMPPSKTLTFSTESHRKKSAPIPFFTL